LDRPEQINQRAPEPIDRPSHHHVEPAFNCVLEHIVETRPLRAPLAAREACIRVDRNDLPTSPLSHASQRLPLVFQCLSIGADAGVNDRPLWHDYSLSAKHYTLISCFLYKQIAEIWTLISLVLLPGIAEEFFV